MEVHEYRNDLLERTKIRAVDHGEMIATAFVAEVAERLEAIEEFSAFVPCHFDGTGFRGRRLRVDGYVIDEIDDSVSLVIGRYIGDVDPESLTATDAGREFTAAISFLREALAGQHLNRWEESSPAYGLACTLQEMFQKKTISKFRLYMVSDGLLSRRVSVIDEEYLDGIRIEHHIWDISRLHQVHESASGRDELVVDFTEFTANGIPSIEATGEESAYQSYLCVIDGNALACLYDRHGSRLLEGNVRAFLSAGGKVNKQIRETILRMPYRFFALNNGISATATHVSIENGRILTARDLQIVNGGQTTASLAHSSKKDRADLASVRVAMKLTVIDPAQAQTLIPEISRSANSQNKVSDADFFSNHPFHVRMEELSRRLWAPARNGAQHATHWFYERARAQYATELSRLSPSQQTKFKRENPREQLVSKTDLARFELSWRQLPHIVSRGAQKNFTKFAELIDAEWKQGKEGEKFNESYFHEAIAHAIVFREAERLVAHAPWYLERVGYRANIVAYAIGLLSDRIAQVNPNRALDVSAIWSQQDLSQALKDQILTMAFASFEVIYSPLSQYSNISEWVKNELCWNRVRQSNVVISDAVLSELADQSDVRDQVRFARKQQRSDGRIQAQKTVYDLGARYWAAAGLWAVDHLRLDPISRRLLEQASCIPEVVISETDSKKLLHLKRQFELDGFALPDK